MSTKFLLPFVCFFNYIFCILFDLKDAKLSKQRHYFRIFSSSERREETKKTVLWNVLSFLLLVQNSCHKRKLSSDVRPHSVMFESEFSHTLKTFDSKSCKRSQLSWKIWNFSAKMRLICLPWNPKSSWTLLPDQLQVLKPLFILIRFRLVEFWYRNTTLCSIVFI